MFLRNLIPGSVRILLYFSDAPNLLTGYKRCKAQTEGHRRCKRRTKNPDGFCPLHRPRKALTTTILPHRPGPGANITSAEHLGPPQNSPNLPNSPLSQTATKLSTEEFPVDLLANIVEEDNTGYPTNLVRTPYLSLKNVAERIGYANKENGLTGSPLDAI